MKDIVFKKGDVVKVWSLQSFYGGGFLEGAMAIISQDQIGPSVFVCVKRNIDGVIKVDPHYEVYSKQLELYARTNDVSAIEAFDNWIKTLEPLSKI